MELIARFELSSDPDRFGEIYDVIDQVVSLTGLHGRQKFKFAVCITEAYTNASVHGNCNHADKQVVLAFCRDAGRLIALIEDQGRGRAGDIPQTLDLKQIKSDKFSGRGVAIMQEFADNFHVTERIDEGIQVRLEWNVETTVPDAAPEISEK